jgi:hypothetical protein
VRCTLVILCFVISGCAAQPPSQAEVNAEIRRDAQVGKQQCDAQFPLGPRINHVANARCINAYSDAVILPRSRYPDLNAMVNSRRMAIAEKADQGVISDNEAEAQMAEIRAYAIGEYDRRDASSAQTGAQLAAARAAQSNSSTIAAPAPVPMARGCWRENSIMVCH